ncbi:MAG: dCTP deaminase [Bifidobacteriaceae bacterium]|jgi:dCTP deaminase|nr:dCTP deaminase [Bifidobacteriaceae bacterium]
MLISDKDIQSFIDDGDIVLEPYAGELLQASSIDVRLANQFLVFDNHKYAYIDPAEEQDGLTRMVEVKDGDPFILHPGEFVLGSTVEKLSLCSSVAARLEGKSSLGRLGILTHSTAGFIDPGFSGSITLELSNISRLPVKLWPGMRIGQLCFFLLSSPSAIPYGSANASSHYQGQIGPTSSRIYDGFVKL